VAKTEKGHGNGVFVKLFSSVWLNYCQHWILTVQNLWWKLLHNTTLLGVQFVHESKNRSQN